MEFVLYTFDSSNYAMKSELLLENKNIKSRLIPLPPKIDAGCGLALRFESNFYKKVEKIFEEENINYKGRYLLIYNENSKKPEIKDYDLS